VNICDEAVDAAVLRYYYPPEWESLSSSQQELSRFRLRQALEAAAPYLVAAAWEQGRVDGYHHRPNPYKETAE
jgi:hypothetical protein